MRMFLISDNVDTQTGMRLSGVEGVLVHTREEVLRALDVVKSDPSIGILIVTEKLASEFAELFYPIKTSPKTPLLVSIPDRHGSSRAQSAIAEYIKEAVGISL